MNASTRRLAYVTDIIYVLRLGLIQRQYSTDAALELVYSVFRLALVANYLSKSRASHGIW